jgi:ABC-type Fe3+ transport system substrate-binding protein
LAFAAEDRDAILAKAKEEKILVLYSTTEVKDHTALVEAFQKRYPFVQPKASRVASSSMAAKVLQEHRAGVHVFDVLSAGEVPLYAISGAGLFQPYNSPERSAYPEGFKDKESLWTSMYHNAGTIQYNTNLVKPDDVPKSYDDLLHPKWKGKMVMDSTEFEWYALMLEILGREKGLQFMRSLAKQDLNFRPGKALITTILIGGEFGLAVMNNDHLTQAAKMRGAPLDSVAAYPVISRVHPIALGRYAPHPNVGKLFIDFVLSEEGQKILESLGRTSSRKGIESDELQKKGVKLHVSDMTWIKDYASYQEQFREVFGLK